jgi:hypothetical protein
MATIADSTSSAFRTVRVNVRLCGSVPRQELESLSITKPAPLSSRTLNTNSYLAGKYGDETLSTHHPIEDEKTCIGQQLCAQLATMETHHRPNNSSRQSLPEFDAPTWAVPGTGESRLEPVCDSLGKQSSIDLTSRAVFRIGRSPQSDLQLFHDTSSRRHAMLFHHSNGGCYLVDCGSAHGTFVNGQRVTSPPSGGVVVPFRVRRGSMIRFGGPGAPQFMLKSFSFDLNELRDPPVINTLLSPSTLGAVVQHNTRLNSLGKTAKDCLSLSLSSKRSFDSVETVESDYENKRMRCSSPPMSPQPQIVRLVSPELGQDFKKRRVSFSSEPPKAFYPNLISPDFANENDCH